MTDTSNHGPKAGIGNTSKAVTQSLRDWTAGIHPAVTTLGKNPCARHVPGDTQCASEIQIKGSCPLLNTPPSPCTGNIHAIGADRVKAQALVTQTLALKKPKPPQGAIDVDFASGRHHLAIGTSCHSVLR
jgi:hypothetical protein